MLAAGIIPLIFNGVWLILPYEKKEAWILKSGLIFAIYTYLILIFCFAIGSFTFLLAETITYDYEFDRYVVSNGVFWTSVFLGLVTTAMALHSASFGYYISLFRGFMVEEIEKRNQKKL